MSSSSTPTPLPPGWGEMVPLVPRLGLPQGGVLGGRYQVEERLAWGGQAAVYRGYDTHFERPVALKFLHRPLHPRALERLEAEALATASLRHPNLLRVLDWAAGDPGAPKCPPYLVTELVTGPTLGEFVRQHGPLVPEAAAMLVWVLCSPLGALHREGLVHRDLKPANVLLDARDLTTLVVADFGLLHWPMGNAARGEPITAPGERIGTLEYMSPEQGRGEPVDERSDVWSLGVLFYELVTGQRPFASSDPDALLAQVRSGRCPPLAAPRLPWYVRETIEGALQVEPSRRLASMAALQDALGAGLDGDQFHKVAELVDGYLRAPEAFGQRLEQQLVQTAHMMWPMVAHRGFDLTRHPMVPNLCQRALLIAPDDAELTRAWQSLAQGEAAARPLAHVTAGSSRQEPATAAPVPGLAAMARPRQTRGRLAGPGWLKGLAALVVVLVVVGGGLAVRRLRVVKQHRAGRGDGVAVVLKRGHYEEALRLATQALARRSGDRRAQWDRAVALEKHTLTRLAAADFEAIGRSGDAALSQPARAQAEALHATDEATRRAWQEMMDRGREMVAGGTISSALVERFPGQMRVFYYDAVRTARTAERFAALRPLAQALDRHFGGGHLERFLDRNAALPQAVRAPMAETYALLTKNPQSLGGERLTAYLQTLQQGKQWDLYMGALVFTGQVRQHVAEYRQLAAASGDPWFVLIAERKQADHERVQGQEAQAIVRLRGALERCEALQLDLLCRHLELSLVVHHRLHNQLPEAAEAAYTGRKHAHQTGDWETEAKFLWELRSIAHDGGDDMMMKLYGEEAELRDAVGCKQLQPFYRARARSAMEMHRYADARREILTGPRCGEPRPLLMLEIMAHLQRVGLPAASEEEVQQELNALRETAQLSPAELAWAEYIEGVLLLSQQPDEAKRLLRHASVLAKELSGSNVIARTTQAFSDNELALQEAASGQSAAALADLKRRWIPAPAATCTVGLIVTDTRRLVLVQGPDGRVTQSYERDRITRDLIEEVFVPHALQAQLVACAKVTVLAPPALHGRADLLRRDLAWAYYRERQWHASTRANSGVELVVESRARLRSPIRASSLLGWGTEDRTVLLPKILRGPGIKPAALLAEMTMAKTIVLLTNTLFQEGISALSLTEYAKEEVQLTAAEVQRREFPDTPLVILSPLPAPHHVGDIREPWSLATAFLEAGVGTVVAAKVDTEVTRLALARIKARIARGESAALVARDERLADRSPGGDVSGITVYESKP